MTQQQSEEQQPPQLLSGAEILATGTMGSVDEPDEQPESALDQASRSKGSQGAAREGLQQPKALHDEQFPGNGAQVRPASCTQGTAILLHERARAVCAREKRWLSAARTPATEIALMRRAAMRSRTSSCRRPMCRRSSRRG